tara:strand:- start:3348 stop:3905 length:558 start_codon:yes stop_codon:yes gene_type:complete
MVAGFYLSDADLGLFKVAERTALLINFVLIVINAVLPPLFASLYKDEKKIELLGLLRKGSALGLLLASPFLIICLAVPKWVLGLYGSGFLDAAPLLQIIAIAQAFNVATGSVGFILNMTGNEKTMRNITLVGNTIGVVLIYLLTRQYGAVGAASALATTLFIQKSLELFFVRKKLGFWVFPRIKA